MKEPREFRTLWARFVLFSVAAVGTSWAAEAGKPQSAPAGLTEATRKNRSEIVAVYYPHWHNYDHGSSWKGEGWTEWEGLKAAVPRFPGHHQPLKPSWGCFDESDPKWSAREIDLAADHGIDVFLFDWYWYSGVTTMEEALEHGFLKAENRQRMKFALMWANHDRRDQFCPEFGKERTVWLPSRHSPRDLRRVVDYGTQYVEAIRRVFGQAGRAVSRIRRRAQSASEPKPGPGDAAVVGGGAVALPLAVLHHTQRRRDRGFVQ
jgi:hypothetical protein